MALTFEQVRDLPHGTVLHFSPACVRTVGPKGGVRVKNECWRFSGRAKTWKTKPGVIQRPVKHGLYANRMLTERDLSVFVLASECPVCCHSVTTHVG